MPAPAWYATDPRLLADRHARADVERVVRNERAGAERPLLDRFERDVARDPAGAFSFDSSGSARLAAGGRTFHAGRFETPTLGELTARATAKASRGSVRLSILRGAHVLTDIGTLQATAPPATLFQVASQLNCLESPSARVVPIRDYLHDHTQGPRAAVSAFPGTLLRHYAAPAPDGTRFTQRDDRCLNLLADVVDPSVAIVRSGYLRPDDVRDADRLAAALDEGFLGIRVGVHDDVDVVWGHDWDGPVPRSPQRIAQVLTSTIALGGYGSDGGSAALALARRSLLRAAYLGTILAAAALRKERVVLTLIGGGVFGNPLTDIWEAIRWSIARADALAVGALDVVVNTREPLAEVDRAEALARGGFVAEFQGSAISIAP